eukprot:GEMP01026950.1.p1 GENE.GEMP01026950.1~~GEMP01026950.1.p1  ORF type:complete len:386 (+),score=80.80 GEMP01026950.1:217-1374(+)
MGSSASREELLRCEQGLLDSMEPRVNFESYDVMTEAPDGKSHAEGEAEVTTEKEEFPIRTLRIRARDNCAPDESPPSEDELDAPIVLLHGYVCGLAIFYKLLPLLVELFQTHATRHGRRKRDIYAFDLLGHGASGRPEFDLDKDDVEGTERYLVQCVHSWVCAVFPDPSQRIHLCGHSFGGSCSALYALHMPDRIASLGLLSPLLGFEPREEQDITWKRRIILWGWEMQITPQGIGHAWGWFGHWLFMEGSKWRFQKLASGVSPEEGARLSEYLVGMMQLQPSNARALLNLFEPILVPKRPLLPRLLEDSECRTRSHFYYGDVDWMRHDNIFQKLPPNVSLVVLQNAGHHIYLDNPVELATHLARAFDASPSRSSAEMPRVSVKN